MFMKSVEKQTTSFFRNNRGKHVFYRIWITHSEPKGLLLIIHGLNSHSGYYQNFASELSENGFGVYAMDLQGSGRSDGERYYISDYEDIVTDIDFLFDIARARHSKVPIFLFGHSAGGVFASVYAVDYQPKLNGLISASFAFQIPAPGFALAIMKLLGYIIPHARLIRLNNADFSRDESFVNAMNNDPLLADEKQPAKTMQQLLLAAAYLEKEMPEIEIPLLILHGSADKATKPAGSKYFMEHASSTDKQFKLYEGYYHDLLNDKYSRIIVKDIMRWLIERV